MREVTVAVLGATGLVGAQLLAGLEERQFPASTIIPLASEGAGRTVRVRGERIPVRRTDSAPLRRADLVFNCAGARVAEQYLPAMGRAGIPCVDKSTAFRMRPDVPLVVPEVNGGELSGHTGIVASPNCLTIQLVMALAPLHRELGLRWVVVSTYQSASGAGGAALRTLRRESRGEEGESPLPHRLAGNLFPEIGRIDAAGHSGEEDKISAETQKILGEDRLPVAVTAVRVPVEIGHGAAVWIETAARAGRDEVVQLLRGAPGVDVALDSYATPRQVAGTDRVSVGRIRSGGAGGCGFWMWVVADNLRKGAATNALQIGERMLRDRSM